MIILYNSPQGQGWHPITYLVHLAAELFEAEVVTVSLRHQEMPSTRRKLSTFRRLRGSEPCLFICRTPMELDLLPAIDNWHKRFSRIVVWLGDFNWTPMHFAHATNRRFVRRSYNSV